MNNYKYILEPYAGMNSRYTCPECNKRKVFARYIDKAGEHLPDKYGKCNRLDKCGYSLSPYKDGYSQMKWENEKAEYSIGTKHKRHKRHEPQAKPQEPVKTVSFIESDLFKQSLKSYEQNNFVIFLNELFGNEITAGLIAKYFIGTSKHWPGGTIFWQIDYTGKIRTGKIMQYSPTTGKRTKEPFNHIAWVHKALKQPEFELKQVFFGEHLLKGNTKPVAIVESEKTCIIASVYFPQFVWIAAGNLNGLNAEKCQALKGRDVILYPDLSKPKVGNLTAFETWSAKAKEFSNIANFIVSDLLERKAGEVQRKEGCDIADYLINFNYKEFTEPETKLNSDDLYHVQWINHTGKEFDFLKIAWIKSTTGKNYEILFNRDEHLLPYGEKTETVKQVEKFYKKTFQPIYFEGEKVYCHIFLN